MLNNGYNFCGEISEDVQLKLTNTLRAFEREIESGTIDPLFVPDTITITLDYDYFKESRTSLGNSPNDPDMAHGFNENGRPNDLYFGYKPGRGYEKDSFIFLNSENSWFEKYPNHFTYEGTLVHEFAHVLFPGAASGGDNAGASGSHPLSFYQLVKSLSDATGVPMSSQDIQELERQLNEQSSSTVDGGSFLTADNIAKMLLMSDDELVEYLSRIVLESATDVVNPDPIPTPDPVTTPPTNTNTNDDDPTVDPVTTPTPAPEDVTAPAPGVAWKDPSTGRTHVQDGPNHRGHGTQAPVLLDLDGDGIEVVFGEDIYFDTDGDGFVEKTAWAAADDGFLVIDLNADGTRGAGDGSKLKSLADWGISEIGLAYDDGTAKKSYTHVYDPLRA